MTNQKMNNSSPKLESYNYSPMKILLSILLVSLVTVQSAFTQIPAPKQAEPIALVGGTIYTMAGEVIENGTILFEDGIITAIGTDVQYPENTNVEDVTGKQIYPGLIDAYSQMGLYEIGAVNMTVDLNEQGRINPNIKTERAFNPESRHIAIARSAGVLTAVSTPGGGLLSGQQAAMALDGWTWEEMTLKSGVSLLVNWPAPNDEYADNLNELQTVFDNAKAYHKARNAMGQNGSRLETDSKLESLIPVIENERPLLVNANRADQIQDAVTWADKEKLDIIILGGADAHLVTDYLVSTNVPVVITAVLTSPNRDWEAYDSRYNLPAKLYEAGVSFAIAGTASAPYSHRLPYEAGAAAAYGLPAEEALKAVTRYPAEIFGLNDFVGTLETGKHASLVITTGNPLEYDTMVEQVYVRGRKSDMNDMHKQLYKKYRKKVDQVGSME